MSFIFRGLRKPWKALRVELGPNLSYMLISGPGHNGIGVYITTRIKKSFSGASSSSPSLWLLLLLLAFICAFVVYTKGS